MTETLVNKVQVDNFEVWDCDSSDVIARTATLIGKKSTIFALHVGGLNNRLNEEFVDAMRGADVVYADGMSIVWLARMAGAQSISRSATTDIGIPMLREMQVQLGRTLRIALVGGPQGLAERAGKTLVAELDAELVFVTHGFHGNWTERLAGVRSADVDVLVVGMGMPQEAIWVRKHYNEIPEVPILTCGGWFGFLAGQESRAPQWMQKRGLEWLYRTFQDPARLARRYAVGAVSVGRTAWSIVSERVVQR